jgi:DeoR-like helix-turn-helix domain
MLPKGSLQEAIRKKTFEVSYALFRVSAVSQNRQFAETLDANAVSMVNGAGMFAYQHIQSLLESTAYLIRFGAEAGIIHSRNADLLLQEMGNLDSLLKQVPQESAQLPEADIAGIFSKAEIGHDSGKTVPAAKIDILRAKADLVAAKIMPSADKANIRQDQILEKIRQSGNVKIGDLQESFPSISERTLRYDLEYLIERGLLERIGSGKATSYQLKAASAGLISLPGPAVTP